MTTQPPSSLKGLLSYQVAEEIRAMLARRRMTQRALADELGVSVSWVSYRMTGVQDIGLNDLQQVAAALGVAVNDLMPAASSTAGAA